MKFFNGIFIAVIVIFTSFGCSLDETSPSVQPSISNVSVSPDSIGIGVTVVISATISDADGTISEVILNYGAENLDSSKDMILESENSYSVEVGPFSENSIIMYQIEAIDNDNGATEYNSSFSVGDSQQEGQILFINEYMSHNDTAYAGEFDAYPDWIEIYNAGDVAIDIAGMYLTDNLTELTASQIPSGNAALTTIQPNGFIILLADSQANPGDLHLSFKLGDEEDFALVDIDGSTIIDQHNTGVLGDDFSEGRSPDGTDSWTTFDVPTPVTSNQ